MVELYFRKTLHNLGIQKSNNLVSHIQKLSGRAPDHSSAKASKLALSFTIANLIIANEDFKKTHINLINSFSTWFVNGTTLYAKAQIAASAIKIPHTIKRCAKKTLKCFIFLLRRKCLK
ncbi:hypothetical protein [Erwinia tasmaniensis]|uniref:Uncharacterized protein n=1 Tax=Erwinia tasmaniensis (strain DSM 17950 / CFBP 7177 / CIP 109463 / NCPPB 4357 / Et1/99) TaxID=465817 RepID=B2VC23_ERWT9|nr:hypothetical protein [Erwinia tasmaniensis]CAO97241.1 hypothetical protein ETA_21950 [Erwinia tasmaniensis Et1/99]